MVATRRTTVENLSAGPAALDLRRARNREAVDRIVDAARVLPEGERALLHAVYGDGRTAAELAALMGEPAHRIRRRVKSLVRKLSDPRLAYVVAASDHWPERRRRIARAVYIEGRSIRQIAREQGLSLYAVRRHILAVQALFEARAASPEAWTAARRHAS